MGNQLTGIAPSQILPVEHYLTDVADHEYESSLGSTRFFKVARASFKEGYTVVKVFVIHDPSLPLKAYKDDLDKIKFQLQGCSNCLPFTKVSLSDKAGLLFRQYVKDSLYDRISTRPFLNTIEKKWIAFQLLCALNQAHKLGICHGDIKSENVMMTSWNWLLLTDFASFKPTFLPEDNPSDFNYFFDTSRRRTCYIAPERFVDISSRNNDPAVNNIDLTSTGVVKTGKRTASMDIFSAGCVLTELFTDGASPFDLSQLLSYRIGEYTPWKVLEKIEDVNIRDLIRSMLQKDPSHRLSAEVYLIEQRGKAFPTYFYSNLKLYLQRFVTMPILPADDRVMRVRRDMNELIKHMNVDAETPSENNGLVIIISLLTGSLRPLKFCSSKLIALDSLLALSQYVTSEVILDRMIPFMLYLVNDPFPRVRAHLLRTITKCLANVKTVPRNDANIFPEYLLPALSDLTQDECVMVREAFAENIALLAETAQRFLEIVHLNSSSNGGDDEEDSESQYEASYDMELEALHEMIQLKVVVLLTDSDNVVKQTLLERGITRLCVFFGRQKANDVLLSHMITFLNDKYDWHLRGAFFDAIVGVAAYVGWQSTSILLPLLQQGLSDTEEFVISKTLCAMISLTDLGLLQKGLIHDLLREVVPFLCHPNLWIRQGAVGFVSAVAKSLNIADVHCNLLPILQPFLKQSILQIDQEAVLLNSLEPPIPRVIYDYILRSQLIEKLFECLYDKQLQRSVTRHGHRPQYPQLDENLNQMFRKLGSQGMSEADEDKLLALKDFMMKLHRARAGSADSSLVEDESVQNGHVNILLLKRHPVRRHADLFKEDPKKNEIEPRKSSKKKSQAIDLPVNEEWKYMFGTSDSVDKSQQNAPPPMSPKPRVDSSAPLSPRASLSRQASLPVVSSATTMSRQSVEPLTVSMSQVQSNVEGTPIKRQVLPPPPKPIEYKYSMCKLELRNLVYSKREQFAKDCVTKDLMESALYDDKPPPPSWKPKGLLVAHLHEHRAAINRIAVSHDHAYFATCSSDGNVKLWEGQRMDGKSITNRSKFTYTKQGGQIKTLAFCEGSRSLASASDNGTIHVVRIEEDVTTNSKQLRLSNDKDVGVQQHGHVVDMNYFDTGAQSVVAYATAYGEIIGWDLRASKEAWILKNNPRHGLITSFDVHHTQAWLSVGTSSGAFVCWDMRFQLPISVFNHSTNARVRRLLVHPQKDSWFVSSMQGNNEVSMWDIETAHREKTLWASCAPVFSTKEASNHSINGLFMGKTDGSCPFVLTAGSDMRVRYWDLNNPENSYIAVGAASDPVNQTSVLYRSKLIDGTEVIQETYGKPKPVGPEDIPRRGPDAPHQGHHDIISDINMYQTGQCFIVTSSRDGVVKVWK